MTHDPAAPPSAEVSDVNQRFYDQLWADSRLVRPERFNTWGLVSGLARSHDRRLEVGPGMRPRLPIENTHFVDISPPALDTLAAEGGITHTAPVSELPHADDSFGLVSALDIIEHVEDDEAALAEISRVAEPGAQVLLSTPLHPEYWTPFDDIVGHYRRYEPDHLMDLLDRHGLEVEQSAIFGMKPRSSRLNDLGMWFLERHRPVAMKVYNRFLMPLGLRLQKPLKLHSGMVATDGVEEVFLVCRRR
ncbi:bifunctional 2-polyprenyl-6-hydroxyphenol methylase/3-demethylubiquinol 3-O-methyltransferase UbiG [Thioalkalivibrio sp. ALgr3]|uniref:class I SAM-dependent methyltransferase n=1 Tax=Thioalkalivibrio sp. ALgr3 TaxID=1239292 RepID=UPI00037C815A|nr:methyltransferase domain-containing protein [Thioalkalivibrio sp. ALgr3]